MLKMTKSSDSSFRPFKAEGNRVISKIDKIFINLSKFKKLKNAKFKIQMRIQAIKEVIFLTLSIKKVFSHLKQLFIKVLIFYHFDLDYYI